MPALAVLVLAVILGFGLSSWASHSGDLAYLEIDAPEAQALDYVVLHQIGMACDADTFIGAEAVSIDDRIEAEVVEDEETIGLCIRADYGYGNYLYEKYGDEDAFIRIEDDGKLRLLINIGGGGSAEYVFFTRSSATCDATAFDSDSKPAPTINDGGILSLPSSSTGVALCLRTNYGGDNYIYKQYGTWPKIDFNENVGNYGRDNPQNNLQAVARHANSLQYVVFNLPGRTCQADSFNIDEDFIVDPDQDRLWDILVESEVLENADALCFRADYGEGNYIYEKYGGAKISITRHYRLTLTAEKMTGPRLSISSNTDVSRWRIVRSQPGGSEFQGGYGQCNQETIEYVAFWHEWNFEKYQNTYRTAADNIAEDPERHFVFDLTLNDHSRSFCVEAIDENGSRSYLNTGPMVSDLKLSVAQQEDRLEAVADDPAQVVAWQAVKTSNRSCAARHFNNQANQTTNPSFELTRRDHNRYYCFRAKDKLGLSAFASSSLIRTAEPSTQLSFEYNYPYQAPTVINSGEDMADFLRPYLSEKGEAVLDQLNAITLSGTCLGPARGCYFLNKRIVLVTWPSSYNGIPPNQQQELFHDQLRIFIHEFMHATYYQDVARALRPSTNCIIKEKKEFQLEYSYDVIEPGIDSPAFISYIDCQSTSSLLKGLRDLYDDLPADREFGFGFSDYQHLTNIEGRWGSSSHAGSFWKHSSHWYTELYAESVFIRELPAGLEKHYSQYFKDRTEIVDIFEATPDY